MNQRGAVIFSQARRDISVHFSRNRTMAPKKQVEDAPPSGGGAPGKQYCRDPIGKTMKVVETHTKDSYADGDSGSGRASEQQLMVANDAHKPWPPVPEELELHDMAVPCPVCKQDTTACGGYFQWDFLLDQWECTQRVYLHASSCCTSVPR